MASPTPFQPQTGTTMKSMQQMQREMLSQCKPGQRYPRPVFHFIGTMQLVFDEEQERRANRQCEIELMIWFWGLVAAVPVAALIIVFLK